MRNTTGDTLLDPEISREQKKKKFETQITEIFAKLSVEQNEDIQNMLATIKDSLVKEIAAKRELDSYQVRSILEKSAGDKVITTEQLYIYNQAVEAVQSAFVEIFESERNNEMDKEVKQKPITLNIPNSYRTARLKDRNIGNVQFDDMGMVVCGEDKKSPFSSGQNLEIYQEEGVGGFVENEQVRDKSGFSQSPYDGRLYLPKKFVDEHLQD